MAKKAGLVTGASAGLGVHFAELFAKHGHDVILVARRKERLEELGKKLQDTYAVKVTSLAFDLADPKAPEAIFNAVADQQVEFLVNNAGFGTNGAFAKLELQKELDMVQVNISSLMYLTRLFLPKMLERRAGRILNVGSTAGFQGGPFMATYYASKAFVNHFTEALCFELKGTGVTATVSCPGATATEFAEAAGNDKSNLFKAGVADAATVAKEAYQAMMEGKPMIIHGIKNKFLMQTLRLAPRATVLAATAKLNKI